MDLSNLPMVDGKVDSKGVYGLMITELLPIGMRGIIVAALMAALMSTVSGALNSISTLASYDLVKRFRPDLGDRQLVKVGRIAAGIALVTAVALVPAINSYQSLFEALNDIISHIAPPITCVFLLGIFWKRASSRGAAFTLIGGSILGGIVFIAKTVDDKNIVNQVPGGFMTMAFILLMICIAMQVIASILLPDPIDERRQLCWDRPWTPLTIPGKSKLGDPRLLSLLLLAAMTVLYSIFR
jgi:SSS family solute:Na+ symporter